MLFRRYWQRLRDDSFRRFRTTLSSASTPLATRDGQVGGCTSSNTRQRARNEGGTWCNYFPSLWNRDAYVVRELRACFVPFLERILCLSKERVDHSDRFLPSVQHRAVSFPLRDDVIQRSSLFHPAFITPLVTTTHRVIFPLYGAPLKFNEISRKRSTCEIRDRSFFFFPLFEVRSISLEQNRLQLDLENLSRYIHCWESVKCKKKKKQRKEKLRFKKNEIY